MYQTLINCRTLNGLLSGPDIVIVDCRFDLTDPAAGRRRYLESHIPGAVYAGLEDHLSGPAGPGTGRHPLPDAERIRQVFSELGFGKDTQVVAYDDMSGAFAARLWWMLRYMGHHACAVLDGGWQDWLAQGFAVEEGNVEPRAADFRGSPRPDRLLEIAEVTSLSCLVDARDPVRYRGESEPLDPVAGHIPGAVNYFWQRNIDEDGRFRDAADLRRDLLSVLGKTAPEEAGVYCGSGVTACHNLLAAVHAGLAMPRLYAGSWSQWCADPKRPVATGE
ncbi:MAG: sulfurtransferase [Gammaproteobacteria bacterium]